LGGSTGGYFDFQSQMDKKKKNLIFVLYDKNYLVQGGKNSPPLSQKLNGHALSLHGEQA
jgi:hypothetical protein